MKYLDKLQYIKEDNDILISYNQGINISIKEACPSDINACENILKELDENPNLKGLFLSGVDLYFITEDNPISRKIYEMKDDSLIPEFRDKLTEISDLVFVEGGYYTHYFLESNAIKAEEILNEYLNGE